MNFDPDQQFSSLHLIAGGAPATADDVVMDAGTAQKYGFTVGQQVRILTAGPTQTFTITGIAEFGTANNLAGRDPGRVHAAHRAGRSSRSPASSTTSTW